MRPIFAAQQAVKEARRRGDAAQVRDAKTRWIQSFASWADRRMALYRAHPGFVADRWEADLLDLWLIHFAAEGVDEATIKLLRNMQFKARMLHCAVVLPFGDMMGGASNGTDRELKRVSSFSLRLLNSIVTKGLIEQCPSLQVIEIPDGDLSVEDRVAFVEARIPVGASGALAR